MSKVGKAVDRNFVPDFDSTAREEVPGFVYFSTKSICYPWSICNPRRCEGFVHYFVYFAIKIFIFTGVFVT